ncbi:MAG: hypothetical protein JWM95_1730 [Gemmatimonadetes bacterium]|nr:hypothetical protein [Gemmatimonadota bacterium]
MTTHREASRDVYTIRAWNATEPEINTGSLQRIADACERSATAGEKMAANWATLTSERDRYKRWYEQEQESRKRDVARLVNVVRALRGVITKLRNRAEMQMDSGARS